MLVLAGRALKLVLRRLPLYAALVLLAIGAQAAIVVSWHSSAALLAGIIIVGALLSTIVYAITAADIAESPLRQAWSLVLERVWAVVVIEFAVSLISIYGFSTSAAGDAFDMILGSLIMLFAATLVFVDASAVVDDEPSVVMLLPRSFARGLAAAWRREVIPRVIAIYVIALLQNMVSTLLEASLQVHHTALAQFWADVPLGTILIPPLSAFVVLVYLDAKNTQGASDSHQD